MLMAVMNMSSAQTDRPSEMLHEIHGEASNDVNADGKVDSDNQRAGEESMVAYPIAARPAITLPDAPALQPARVRVIDKKFIAVMAALGGAETLRFTTHQLVLQNEFAAGAPWVTRVPDNRSLIAQYALIYAAEVFVAYELKKPHSWLPGDRFIRKAWWVYPAVMTPIHISNGVRSIRTEAPSCPVELCQAQ
jgi:hypothetical protein